MDDGRKLGFHSWNLMPKAAICDPDLTLGLPPALTAATGMDAIAHCMEHKMPILVFNYRKEGNIARAVRGEKVGTLISSKT